MPRASRYGPPTTHASPTRTRWATSRCPAAGGRTRSPAGDALKSFLGHYPGRVLIAADSPYRREALLEVLQAAELKPPVVADLPSFLASDARFAIAVAPLEDGFALDDPRIAVLTERQLFPERAGSTRRTRRAASRRRSSATSAS